MRKSLLFEAVLVVLIIVLLSVLYVAINTSPGRDGGQGEGWTLSGVIAAPPVDYFMTADSLGNMFAGDDGTLYTVDGRRIHAIAGKGSVLWTLEIPERYLLPSYGNGSGKASFSRGSKMITYTEQIVNGVVLTSDQPWSSNCAIVHDGNLYILLKREHPVIISGVLLSVSPNGSLRWALPFANGWTGSYNYQYGLGAPGSFTCHNDVMYVSSHNGGLSIVGLDGNITGYIGKYDGWGQNYIGKPAIGGDTLFVQNESHAHVSGGSDKIAMSIDAYRTDGTLIWRRSLDEYGINESMMNFQESQPYLRNGTLYVWLNDGFVAFDVNGSLRFRYHVPEGFLVGCGFDQNDTLYVSYGTFAEFPYRYNQSGLVIMRPDGSITQSVKSGDIRYLFGGLQEVPDGVLYMVRKLIPYDGRFITELDINQYTPYFDGMVREHLKNHTGRWEYPRSLSDLDIFEVEATDLITGKQLWSYLLPMKRQSIVLDPYNAARITIDEANIADVNSVTPEEWYRSAGIPAGSAGIRSSSWAYPTMGNGTMYVNAWSYNYEYPPFYGKARCLYSGGLYAVGLNGTPEWSISTDARVVSVKEVNGTIYYGTGGGKVSTARAGVAAGIVTAAVYLFFRFFLLGGVTRARARLERNPNRTSVLQYIKDNPGVTLFDAAEGLEMNPGTVRYHLMILGLNHRITSFRADEKFVRYFVNSGAYGPGDQLVISMMRREPLRKIVSLLAERPGLSNVELSRALDVQESSTMRNVKLLMEKGIVTKSLMPDGKIAYSLSSEYIITVVTEFCARVKTCA